MTLKNKIIDTIECLKSYIEDEKGKDTSFNDDFEDGAIFGRIDAYEKVIELLNDVLNGK